MSQLTHVPGALWGAQGSTDHVEIIRIIISPRCGLPD